MWKNLGVVHLVSKTAQSIQSVVCREPRDAQWPAWVAAVGLLSAGLVTAHVDSQGTFWAFWALMFVISAFHLDYAFLRPQSPLRTSHLTSMYCMNRSIDTMFDWVNPADWVSLLSISLDPLFLAAVGLCNFRFVPTAAPLPPIPSATFDFADEAAGHMLMQYSAQQATDGLIVALVLVGVLSVLPMSLRIGATAESGIAGTAIVPITSQLMVAAFTVHPAYLGGLAVYLPRVLAPPDQPGYSNVRYSPRFVACERAIKIITATSCVALAYTGRDLAQAAVAIFSNIFIGVLLLVCRNTVWAHGIIRVLGHGFSIVAIAVAVAVRYGAPNAKMFGWGALFALLVGFSFVCMCSALRRRSE